MVFGTKNHQKLCYCLVKLLCRKIILSFPLRRKSSPQKGAAERDAEEAELNETR